jgi:hypothetical protein
VDFALARQPVRRLSSGLNFHCRGAKISHISDADPPSSEPGRSFRADQIVPQRV